MRTDDELSVYPLSNLRVQYMLDADPFNSLSVYPLPSRAPVFSFVITTPLATQLGALLRLLGAPQRVRRFTQGFFICFLTDAFYKWPLKRSVVVQLLALINKKFDSYMNSELILFTFNLNIECS